MSAQTSDSPVPNFNHAARIARLRAEFGTALAAGQTNRLTLARRNLARVQAEATAAQSAVRAAIVERSEMMVPTAAATAKIVDAIRTHDQLRESVSTAREELSDLTKAAARRVAEALMPPVGEASAIIDLLIDQLELVLDPMVAAS
jgi:hypothetical protein